MEIQDYPSRYLYISGAFAAGGTFTRIAPNVNIHLQVPTIAPVHLPMVGGTSEATLKKKVDVDCRAARFGAIGREQLRKWKAAKVLSVGWAHSLAQSEPEKAGQPFRSRSVSEVKAVRIADGLFLKRGILTLQSSHDPKNQHPEITFGETDIAGLKLGKDELRVTLDLDPFNKYPTLEGFETAFQKDSKLRERLLRRLVTDRKTGQLYKNTSGYVIASMVQKVEGLPADASWDGGSTITWPKFGKIILGEILMGPYVRRVTLVRFKHSDGEIGSGCSGGSTYP